jgi:hypothetical protein
MVWLNVTFHPQLSGDPSLSCIGGILVGLEVAVRDGKPDREEFEARQRGGSGVSMGA